MAMFSSVYHEADFLKEMRLQNLIELYKACGNTPEGQEVLQEIYNLMGYWDIS